MISLINKIIIDVIKSLGIKCYFMEAANPGDKYVLFNTFLERDTDILDNKSMSTTYYIQLNYWYKNPVDVVLYKQIKETMKTNGFKYDSCKDSKDGDYYCKAFDFKYKERV